MEVLTVGSSSPIGTAVTRLLRERGHTVTVAGRSGADLCLDLTRGPTEKLEGRRFDAVLNLAGDLGDDPDLAEAVNAAGALRVARLAAASGAAHLVQVSTVYAGCPECYPGSPAYPLSKLRGERLAADACREAGVGLAILRPTHVYDEDGACRPRQELPYLFADRAERGEAIEIFGRRDVHRDYLHLTDLAETLCRMVVGGHTGRFVCASPRRSRISEVAAAAYAAFGTAAEVRFRTDMADLPELPAVDGEGLYRRIGFRPRIGVEQGMQMLRDARREAR